MRVKNPNSAAGFTIIELLIATLVFAVVLIIITTGVLQFTRQYYRGVIESQTQNTARSLMDSITQSIQLNPGSVSELRKLSPSAPFSLTDPIVGYCVGGAQRYSFVSNVEVTSSAPFGTHQGAHALVSDTTSGCTTATAALNVSHSTVLTDEDPNTSNPPINARELLGEHMRLVKFSIDHLKDASGAPIPNMDDVYKVTVRVVYGDDDLLCSPNANTCDSASHPASTLNGQDDIQCKSVQGSQFCAVAEYTTTVKKRVN